MSVPLPGTLRENLVDESDHCIHLGVARIEVRRHADSRAGPIVHDDVARELSPDPGDYRHHRGGEDNGDAHLKNLLVHHQVIVPVTDGRLDLGPWQQVFYCEFDGGRPKRMVIKVLGE